MESSQASSSLLTGLMPNYATQTEKPTLSDITSLTFLSQLIIDHPLLGVTEDLIGLCNLLELFFCVSICVLVWVEAQCHAPVCLLDFLLIGALWNTQSLVVVFPHSWTQTYTVTSGQDPSSTQAVVSLWWDTDYC